LRRQAAAASAVSAARGLEHPRPAGEIVEHRRGRGVQDGPMRFSELQRAIGGISQKMLTTTLRGVERDGYLGRSVTPSIPPRVDYALTGLGRELLGPIRALEAFARGNQARIAAARAVFDAPEAAIGGKPQAAGARQARSRF
jgi:DNA-binding HxlR family transcriptional regulator